MLMLPMPLLLPMFLLLPLPFACPPPWTLRCTRPGCSADRCTWLLSVPVASWTVLGLAAGTQSLGRTARLLCRTRRCCSFPGRTAGIERGRRRNRRRRHWKTTTTTTTIRWKRVAVAAGRIEKQPCWAMQCRALVFFTSVVVSVGVV